MRGGEDLFGDNMTAEGTASSALKREGRAALQWPEWLRSCRLDSVNLVANPLLNYHWTKMGAENDEAGDDCSADPRQVRRGPAPHILRFCAHSW